MNSFLNRAIYFAIIFITISVPLPFKFSNIGIVALVVFWLAKKMLNKEKIRSFKQSNQWNMGVVGFVLLFAWQAISLIYGNDIEMGLKNLESKLSLIIFPLILSDLNLQKQQLVALFKYYVYSIIVCNLFLMTISVVHFVNEGTFLIYHDFTAILGFHAVFYSYCLFLSILFTYYLFSKQQLRSREKAIQVLSLIIAFVALVISASKNVLVVTTLSICILLVSNLLSGKIKLKHLAWVIGIILIAIVTSYQSPTIKNRISELTQLNGIENLEKIKNGEVLKHEDRIKFNGTSLRIVFWHLGLQRLQADNRLLIGLSPSDRRAIMNEEFQKVGLYPAYKDYNIHNQFLQILIELGVIGLLFYLAIHILYMVQSLKSKNYILLAYLLAFVFFQITESVIERNKGIVFFVFFLLLIQQLSHASHEDRNIRY